MPARNFRALGPSCIRRASRRSARPDDAHQESPRSADRRGVDTDCNAGTLPVSSKLKEISHGQTINTNINSLNAQRNLSISQLAGHHDAAPVVGPARQQRQGRRRRPGHLRALEHPDARPERRRPQCQRRHLAGADRRRRAGQGRRHPAAHARTGGAVVQRHQQRDRPQGPAGRSRPAAAKSTASPRPPTSTAPSCSTAVHRQSSRSAPTRARPSRSPRSPTPRWRAWAS